MLFAMVLKEKSLNFIYSNNQVKEIRNYNIFVSMNVSILRYRSKENIINISDLYFSLNQKQYLRSQLYKFISVKYKLKRHYCKCIL